MKASVPILLLLVLSPVLQANDWPSYRGPNGDNTIPDAKIVSSFPEGGPKVRWSVDVHAGYGGAAIVGDEVYIMDRVDQEIDVLACVSLVDGKERWRWEHKNPGRISHPGSRTVPTVSGDAVYGSSGFGHVYCVDRKTGKKRWVIDVAKTFDSQPPRFGYAVHPLIHGDHCIIAPIGDSVGLAALDKKTGKTVWTTKSIGDSHSSPLIVKLLGREVLVMPGSSRGTLMLTGFDPKDGKQLFQYTEELRGRMHNSIPNLTVINTDSAFLTGGYGQGTKVLKFTEKDGKISVARTNDVTAGATIHNPLVVGDKVYITAGQGRGGRGRSGGDRFRGRSVPRPGGQPSDRNDNRGRPARPGPDGDSNDESRPGAPQARPGGGRSRPGGFGGGGQSGLICMDHSGKVLWKTGENNTPDLGGGSIINAGGTIISQDGSDGTLRLIKPDGSYRELAKGKVFGKEPGAELWAPLALSKGLLVMRSQNQMVCVDLRPAAKATEEK